MKRNNHYAREYGISLDQYNELLKAQEGKCSICGATDPRHSHKESLIVDHCHKTGAIRGLLCSPCNVALGHFQDSPSLLRTAAAYLEDSQSNGHNRPKQDLPAVACGRLPKAPSKAS